MVRDENLDFWLQNHYNVLFVGHAGVGKTSIVKAAFERHNLNYRYFSASTMDPWVDLVGVPKECQDGEETYLDLIRPRGLDQVEAIFFDEFNRSHAKIRNACMELLQFKTINGRPFPNLKVIWAAINPDDDDTYDVETLDPAQKDRFEIHIDIPYEPHRPYFEQKYGQLLANSALAWWNGLSQETKFLVSPRRLDYALDVYSKDGDLRYVLPTESNVSKLVTIIQNGPTDEILQEFLSEKNIDGARQWIAKENNYQIAIELITKSEPLRRFFLPLLSQERLATLATQAPLCRFFMKNCRDEGVYAKLLRSIVEAKQNQSIVRKISREIGRDKEFATALGYPSTAPRRRWPMLGTKKDVHIGPDPDDQYFASELSEMRKRIVKVSSNVLISHDLSIFYSHISQSIPATITIQSALDTLFFLNAFVEQSKETSLKKTSNLVQIVNNCFVNINRSTNLPLSEIAKKYSGEHFPVLWKRLRADRNMSSKLYAVGEAK